MTKPGKCSGPNGVNGVSIEYSKYTKTNPKLAPLGRFGFGSLDISAHPEDDFGIGRISSASFSTYRHLLTPMQIRQAAHADIAAIATLISTANRDVALMFGLNADNCPKHPSFCTDAWVAADLARGERYFIAEENASPIACVAYESPGAGLAYLNRLSVLPACRKRGVGAALVRHIVRVAQADAIQKISIGVIGEHVDLQRWYAKLGFKPGETKRFPHLPFSVIYMTYAVQGGQPIDPALGREAAQLASLDRS